MQKSIGSSHRQLRQWPRVRRRPVPGVYPSGAIRVLLYRGLVPDEVDPRLDVGPQLRQQLLQAGRLEGGEQAEGMDQFCPVGAEGGQAEAVTGNPGETEGVNAEAPGFHRGKRIHLGSKSLGSLVRDQTPSRLGN